MGPCAHGLPAGAAAGRQPSGSPAQWQGESKGESERKGKDMGIS